MARGGCAECGTRTTKPHLCADCAQERRLDYHDVDESDQDADDVRLECVECSREYRGTVSTPCPVCGETRCRAAESEIVTDGGQCVDGTDKSTFLHRLGIVVDASVVKQNKLDADTRLITIDEVRRVDLAFLTVQRSVDDVSALAVDGVLFENLRRIGVGSEVIRVREDSLAIVFDGDLDVVFLLAIISKIDPRNPRQLLFRAETPCSNDQTSRYGRKEGPTVHIPSFDTSPKEFTDRTRGDKQIGHSNRHRSLHTDTDRRADR